MIRKVIRKKQTNTSRWSGGTTTELYIYPENSVFKEKNFSFRISTATVEIKHSTFTPLEGVHRTLLVLEGNAILEHKHYHTAFLSELEQDHFEGGWDTKCTGILKDFNLMTTGNTSGKVKAILQHANALFSIKTEADLEIFYLYQGELSYEDDQLSEGDLVVLQKEQEDVFRFEAKTLSDCVIIHVKINLEKE